MNVIVLVSDTFRYDYLGCNGNDWIGTQALDQFAQRAVSFDRHYLSSFPTIPNRTDLFTGRYSFPFHGWKPLEPGLPVMSTVFKDAGYTTQLICDTPHLMKGTHHFDRGFDGAHWIRGQEGDKPLLKGNLPPSVVIPNDKTRVDPHMRDTRFGNLATLHRWTNRDWAWEEDRFCVKTAQSTSRWLEENHDAGPFLLWVDFFDAHEPWDPPEHLVTRYDSDKAYDGPPMIHPNYGPATAYTKRELANLKAHYAGEIYLVNKWIGTVLQKIEELNLFDDTIVVFTSDHGMFVGEHNRTGKSNIHDGDERIWPLYGELSHIPLMMSVPGVKGGKRTGELTQSVDLLPTLLALTGTKTGGLDPHGHSLVPLMGQSASGSAKGWPRKYAFSSTFLRNGGPTVTDKRWTYLAYGEKGGKPELYDLKADPQQKKNIIRQEPKVAARMHRALTAFLKDVGTPEENYELIGPVGGPDYT
ncbi:MAG: sulfatase [Gemmatimonadetes bacterium]|nr:sulfatase [Gemmatimonadota bacterium]MBT7864646.1 sulfatase [Gemmatimonadota bacterium]